MLYTKENKQGYEYKGANRDSDSLMKWVQTAIRKIEANDSRKLRDQNNQKNDEQSQKDDL